MGLSRFLLNSSGIQDYLDGGRGVEAMLRREAESVLANAQAAAPVETGAYVSSLHIEDDHTDRMVLRVVADVDYAMVVEADHGTLSGAL